MPQLPKKARKVPKTLDLSMWHFSKQKCHTHLSDSAPKSKKTLILQDLWHLWFVAFLNFKNATKKEPILKHIGS